MKKKLLILVLVMSLLLITACEGNDSAETYNSDWQDSLAGSQGIQIKDANDGMVYATYSEDAEIEEFITELEIDKWKPADVTDDAEAQYYVVFYKQDTIKAGESDEDVNDSTTTVGRITTYKDSPVISMESLGLNMSFAVPQSAIEAIENAQP